MLRKRKEENGFAKAWRSKAQTSNGGKWKRSARAMDARRSFDKQKQCNEKQWQRIETIG